MPLPSITCPKCGRTSYNAGDVEHRYCGACHQFHEDMDLAEIEEKSGRLHCPECFQMLRPVWFGILACFCRWGGRRPSIAEIVEQLDRDEQTHKHRPSRRE